MFKKIMKDERGLSLVELLAVVVIMAVIAGIGAVAITGVIQRNREDAAISSLQNVAAAANLYQTSNIGDTSKAIGGTNPVTGETLLDEGFITNIGSLEGSASDIEFTLDSDGRILTSVKKGVFSAGTSKVNKAKTNLTETQIANMTRDDFLEAP